MMIFLNWICFFHQINKCRTTKVTSVQSIVSKCLDTGAPIYWLIAVWLTLLWSRLTHHVASLRTEASIAICLNIVHWQCHPSQSHLKKGHYKPSKQYVVGEPKQPLENLYPLKVLPWGNINLLVAAIIDHNTELCVYLSHLHLDLWALFIKEANCTSLITLWR
jgi:hypothetical protein